MPPLINAVLTRRDVLVGDAALFAVNPMWRPRVRNIGAGYVERLLVRALAGGGPRAHCRGVSTARCARGSMDRSCPKPRPGAWSRMGEGKGGCHDRGRFAIVAPPRPDRPIDALRRFLRD